MGSGPLRMLATALRPAHSVKRSRLSEYLNLPSSRYRDHNFEFDRIVTVDDLGFGETVGVEVADVHTHVTAGLVTHNTRGFQVEEIARIYGVPPHLIAATDKQSSWGTGIEQQTLGFLKFTLMPLLVGWEQAISRDLILAPSIYHADHAI